MRQRRAKVGTAVGGGTSAGTVPAPRIAGRPGRETREGRRGHRGSPGDRLPEEGRRAGRGADVVVAFAECHGRARTEAMLDGLEVVPRARCAHRGGQLEEMDLAAVLARWLRVALVDEFAHPDVTGGGRRPKRRHSVEVLLDAGIDVMTAVNVQHLESLRPERLWQRPLPEPAGAVVAEAVRREADAVFSRLRFRLS